MNTPRTGSVAIRSLLLVVSLAAPAAAQARFGAYCQADFQNGWRETVPYVWNRCGWFMDELDDTDTRAFYWNLHGARPFFSSCDTCGGGADTVRLLYVNTHGGAKGDTNARLTMWEQNVRALSNTDGWRYGDGGPPLGFLSLYACETLNNDDGNIWGRWGGTFRGGLIMARGSHDILNDGVTTDETGEDFADGLQKGKSAKWAWFDGNGDWDADQDVKVMATGSSATGAHDASADCAFRRDTVTWQNAHQYARWRDAAAEWWCTSQIEDN